MIDITQTKIRHDIDIVEFQLANNDTVYMTCQHHDAILHHDSKELDFIEGIQSNYSIELKDRETTDDPIEIIGFEKHPY